MAQNAQYLGNGTNPDVQVFEYPAVAAASMPSWEAFPGVAMHDSGDIPLERKPDEPPETQQAFREAHVEELRQNFEAGLARGLAEGRLAERQSFAAVAMAQEARRIEGAERQIENFNALRTRYLESVEREVVKLALAVAARILRREAQMDPLLLSGAVRVALGQLSASTKVRLRVPAADLELWRDTIAHLPNLAVKPTVVAEEGMSQGECALEAELGSVDLSLGAQLAEIEHALFDGAGPHREPDETRMLAMKVAEDMAE